MHHAYHCLALTFWRIWRGKQLKAVRKHCSHLAAITFRTILLYTSIYINPIPPMEPSRNASHCLLLRPNHYPLHTISRKSTPFSASFLAAPPRYQPPAPPPRSLPQAMTRLRSALRYPRHSPWPHRRTQRAGLGSTPWRPRQTRSRNHPSI